MTAESNARRRLREYMARHHIDPWDERSDLPIGLNRTDIAPLRGSVHIASGRVAKKNDIDALFKRLRFR
jgi:hypothetical protein